MFDLEELCPECNHTYSYVWEPTRSGSDYIKLVRQPCYVCKYTALLTAVELAARVARSVLIPA